MRYQLEMPRFDFNVWKHTYVKNTIHFIILFLIYKYVSLLSVFIANQKYFS